MPCPSSLISNAPSPAARRPLDPRERHHLCACGAPLLARYDLDAARALVARQRSTGREPNMWRYRELLPLFDGEAPVTLGEGFTPLFHARALGATLGLIALYIKDESLNPTNSFKARGQSAAITRAHAPRRDDDCAADRRQCRQRRGRLLPRAPVSRAKVFIPRDVEAAVRRRMRAVRRRRHAGRRPDHRRRPHGRRARRAARLVRRLDAEGAVPHRRQEDDGVRARRADGLALARLDRLSDRRRHRHGRHVEGVRRDRAHRLGEAAARGRAWCRCRPKAARRSCARSSRAPRRRSRGKTRRTIADGLRVPRAIGDFLILRAVRESGGTAVAVPDRGDDRRHARDRQARRASAPRPKAAPRWPRSERSSRTDRSSRRVGRAVQYRRRAQISRRPG